MIGRLTPRGSTTSSVKRWMMPLTLALALTAPQASIGAAGELETARAARPSCIECHLRSEVPEETVADQVNRLAPLAPTACPPLAALGRQEALVQARGEALTAWAASLEDANRWEMLRRLNENRRVALARPLIELDRYRADLTEIDSVLDLEIGRSLIRSAVKEKKIVAKWVLAGLLVGLLTGLALRIKRGRESTARRLFPVAVRPAKKRETVPRSRV